MNTLPNGWEDKKISEISTLVTSGARDWAQYYSDEGCKFIRMTNLNRDGIDLLLDDLKFVDINLASSEGKRTSLKSGDVLISITAELGKIGWIPENFGESYINQHTALVRLKNDINSKFIAYLISSEKYNKKLNSLNDAGAKAGLNLPTIRNLTVVLPPLPEQQKIAEILTTWDNAIATTEKLLANSQQQKQALMQQLLTGKKRLKDENGEWFCGEWKYVKLGSVSDMNSGGTPKSTITEYYNGNILWVSISDMTKQGKWITQTETMITKKGLENSSARLYPKNTILYAMYASIGECSIASVELASSQAILGIRPKESLYFEYLYFYLYSLKEKIKLQGQQGTQSNLNAGMVKSFIIPLPPLPEQQKIAAVLTTADDEIHRLQCQLDSLKTEKKALMQQLLTGKRRVKI